MSNPWLQFIACALLIVFAGVRLTRSAAMIAQKTGIGSLWAGALLLPFATSLPEAVTTFRAVLINTPDLAMGNILGSCLYNLFLLSFIDLLEGRKPLSAKVSSIHILPASLGIIAISLLSLGVLRIVIYPFGWVGVESLLIIVLYIGGNRLIYRQEKKLNHFTLTEELKPGKKDRETVKAVFNFMVAALVILTAGSLLTDAADSIAIVTGLGHTFIGSIFLAISTSLPETVTTISAVKLGYLDMAVANIFGANFMNLLIIAMADLFFLKGPISVYVSGNHSLTIMMVIVFTAVMIAGFVYRSSVSLARMGLDTLAILVAYPVIVIFLLRFAGN